MMNETDIFDYVKRMKEKSERLSVGDKCWIYDCRENLILEGKIKSIDEDGHFCQVELKNGQVVEENTFTVIVDESIVNKFRNP